MSQTSGILERELLAMRPGKYFQFIKLLSLKKKVIIIHCYTGNYIELKGTKTIKVKWESTIEDVIKIYKKNSRLCNNFILPII